MPKTVVGVLILIVIVGAIGAVGAARWLIRQLQERAGDEAAWRGAGSEQIAAKRAARRLDPPQAGPAGESPAGPADKSPAGPTDESPYSGPQGPRSSE